MAGYLATRRALNGPRACTVTEFQNPLHLRTIVTARLFRSFSWYDESKLFRGDVLGEGIQDPMPGNVRCCWLLLGHQDDTAV